MKLILTLTLMILFTGCATNQSNADRMAKLSVEHFVSKVKLIDDKFKKTAIISITLL